MSNGEFFNSIGIPSQIEFIVNHCLDITSSLSFKILSLCHTTQPEFFTMTLLVMLKSYLVVILAFFHLVMLALQQKS